MAIVGEKRDVADCVSDGKQVMVAVIGVSADCFPLRADVLEEISRKPTDTNDYPQDRVEIRSVKIACARE